MAFVSKSASRVGTSKPRNASRNALRNPWRIAFKALTGGLWVVAASLLAMTTLLLGTGWLLATSTSARSAVQPLAVLAIPPGGLDFTAISKNAMADGPAATGVSASTAVAERFVFGAPVVEPMGRLASAPRFASTAPAAFTPHDELPFFTGSISAPPAKFTARLTAREDAPSVPLPRIRPKLASLGPIDGLGIKPAEAPHPPRTAIYDITAQTVYLPNGERLEAHSGLGEMMDNPSSVRQKWRGVTPPNTYELKLREALFHGVQAIRLTPVDEDKMFGRDGMLAHSYLLGPNGQSHGCISFKDYPRFLRAFQRGEIERIVVVPRLSRPPTFAAQPKTKA
jgi:hypothetical protein